MVMYIENCKESVKDLLELGVNLGKSTILVHKNWYYFYLLGTHN